MPTPATSADPNPPPNPRGPEFRSSGDRHRAGLAALGDTIRAARLIPFWAARLPDPGTGPASEAMLAPIPILRKGDLPAMQAALPPFGGISARPAGAFSRLFLSPGPICEPGGAVDGGAVLAMRAAGVRAGDVVLNCFGYHLTPAGLMFDDAARSLGAAVIPAGGGNTLPILQAMRAYAPRVYVGTPDYLNILIEAADAAGQPQPFQVALLSAAALPASLRTAFTDRGIAVFEQYGTAELGIIAYETHSHDGMVLAESLWAEIVAPGSGEPLPEGEVGELVVTLFRPDYPLIRFGTGDLSGFAPGHAASGHTNRRLRGWLGRADDAVKVKGMFLRPSMLAEVLAALPSTLPAGPSARFVIDRVAQRDRLTLEIGAAPSDELGALLVARVRDVTRLGCELRWVAPEALAGAQPILDHRPRPA